METINHCCKKLILIFPSSEIDQEEDEDPLNSSNDNSHESGSSAYVCCNGHCKNCSFRTASKWTLRAMVSATIGAIGSIFYKNIMNSSTTTSIHWSSKTEKEKQDEFTQS